MDIQCSPSVAPRHLSYAPLIRQRENLFFRYRPVEQVLTQGDIKKALQAQRISLQFSMEWVAHDRELIIAAIVTMAIFLTIWTPVMLTWPFKPNINFDYYHSRTYCDNNTGHQWISAPRFPLERKTVDSANDFLLCLFPAITMAVLGVITGVCSPCLTYALERRLGDDEDVINGRIDALLHRLSAGDDLKTKIPTKIFLNAFPLLTPEALRLLSFTQLTQAKRVWDAHFQEKLKSGQYAKKQLAIWRLLQQLREADGDMRKQILSHNHAIELIGSEPAVFQAFYKTLQPDHELQEIFRHIFTQKILLPQVAKELSQDQIRHIFDRLNSDMNLIDIIAALKNPKQEAFEQFLAEGRLTVHDWQEYLHYYKRILEQRDAPLMLWYEGFANHYIAQLANPNTLHELDRIGAASLILKIDTHLKSSTLPGFPSTDFATYHAFVQNNPLPQCRAQLRAQCLAHIAAFSFGHMTGKQVYMDIQGMYQQIQALFADDMLGALEKHLLTLLPGNPKMIAKLAKHAETNNDAWMLSVIAKAYKNDPTRYASYWLSPFTDQELESVTISD